MLLEAGLVRRKGLEVALKEQRARGGRLCYHLMRMGKVTPASLYLFLQEHFGVITPDLLEMLRTSPAVDMLPARLAHFYQMVPLRRKGDSLLLALANTDNPNLIPAVEELTGLKVDPVICPPSFIQEALERFFETHDEAVLVRNVVGDNVLILSDRRQSILPATPDSLVDNSPPLDWLRAIIAEAIKRHCPEILLEPLHGEARVNYRPREGEESTRALAPSVRAAVTLALEDLAKMAARGRTVPREGRFRLRQDDRWLAILVTSLPDLQGDAYHLRLVEERIRKENLGEMLEDYPEARSTLENALARKKGLLLLAAPEGHYRERILSTLVSSLQWEGGRSILLTGPEGPRLPGIDSRELAITGAPPLPKMVAAAVRDRPDLLTVLCVRTREEVAALFEAANDCLVVAGVRQSDAFEALEWLCHLGFLSEIQTGRLCGILGARMVERICEHCRKRCDVLEDFPNLGSTFNGGGVYFTNTGCRACREAGILDLEPAFEFLPGAFALSDLPGTFAGSEGIRRARARAGVKTLFSSLMARAAAGEVDVREPLRLLFHEGRGSA